jgi:amidase/aspartyl-tRNA(Asn)/glutamyl-tRNA(Gln) amidotransferase subunit A
MRIAYTPDYDVFPIDRRVAAAVADAVRVFEEAGAHVEEVKLGIDRDQRELSDLWCRLIMPINVAGIEGLKAAGIDLLRDHPDDLPPQYRMWLERGYELTALDIANDQAMRTEVFDAFQGVFADYDLIVGPTLCALPVENATDGSITVGPSEVEGVEVDELIGWCPTYLVNYTGHPAASIPAGMADGLPVGMQVIGRRYADADVLAASGAFERLRPWQDTYRIPAGRAV